MSVFGDAIGAIKQVILMQARMDQVDQRLRDLASDMDGLVDTLADVRDRVSRLEGVVQGATMAARPRRIEE